jgi:hypothetical protein
MLKRNVGTGKLRGPVMPKGLVPPQRDWRHLSGGNHYRRRRAKSQGNEASARTRFEVGGICADLEATVRCGRPSVPLRP